MNQKFTQSEQDTISMDFDRWSHQQRQLKLDASHDRWRQEKEAVLSRWQSENDATRREYLAGLEAAKAEKQSQHDREIDAELEPAKQTLMRGWLANNPDQTPADFEKKAWQHLRANLIEQRKADAFDAELRAAKASGRYSL